MKQEHVIGVLGGMGTYATIHMFQQYAEVFTGEKEWDRPRIVIDNRCTMPSRVRAYMYKENVDKLIDEMSDSLEHLINVGCDRIILACNTSHLFLPAIYNRLPELKDKVVNIIDCSVDYIASTGLKEIFLLGSEGTIDSGIYQKAFEKHQVKCIVPRVEEYEMLRSCIEAVKQNKYNDSVKELFVDLANRSDACLLGCTELPILYEKYRDKVYCQLIFDPLLLGLKKIKRGFEKDE